MEDCTNGVDDNGDGLVDCLDPQCSAVGFACVPVPSGWALGTAVGGSGDSCVDGWPQLAFKGGASIEWAPLSCSCDCGAASGAVCSPVVPDAVVFGEANCTGTGIPLTVLPGFCVPQSAPMQSVLLKGSTATGGSCPQVVTHVVQTPPPAFTDPVHVCAPPQASAACGDSAKCAPPSLGGQCLYKQGITECPDDSMVRRELLALPYDSRACNCQCSPGSACPQGVALFSDSTCGQAVMSTTAVGCTPWNTDVLVAGVEGDIGQPACKQDGILYSGSVSPNAAYTLCCPGG